MLVGLFYIVSGLYFRTPTAVQPMKAIGAYAITAGLTQQQIAASGLWMAVLLLLLGGTNLITYIRRLVPLPTIREARDSSAGTSVGSAMPATRSSHTTASVVAWEARRSIPKTSDGATQRTRGLCRRANSRTRGKGRTPTR